MSENSNPDLQFIIHKYFILILSNSNFNFNYFTINSPLTQEINIILRAFLSNGFFVAGAIICKAVRLLKKIIRFLKMNE